MRINKIAIFVKSYEPDIEYCKKLIASISKFNKDNLPIIVSVPKTDFRLFAELFSKNDISVVQDEDLIPEHYFPSGFGGFTSGYLNQQLIKLSCFKIGFADNYFIVDSDCIFIADFYESDFFDFEGNFFTVLSQDKLLRVDPSYRSYDLPRQESLKKIRDHWGYRDNRLLSAHGHAILNTELLESFETELNSDGLNFSDLIRIAPYEFSWYNFWVQAKFPEKIIPVEPLILTIHTRKQFDMLTYNNIKTADIARGFIGICINSNWLKKARSSGRLTARIGL